MIIFHEADFFNAFKARGCKRARYYVGRYVVCWRSVGVVSMRHFNAKTNMKGSLGSGSKRLATLNLRCVYPYNIHNSRILLINKTESQEFKIEVKKIPDEWKFSGQAWKKGGSLPKTKHRPASHQSKFDVSL